MANRNVGESVHAKLRNMAKQMQVDTSVLFRRYAQERLLYRLSVSPSASEFCVKGGLLLTIYNNGNLLRPTEDIDFNGMVPGGNVTGLRTALVAVLETPVEDDGVRFDIGSMVIDKDRVGVIPGGKIRLAAMIHTARVEVRIDVGFGNAITPDARMMEMPTLLGGEVPRPTVLAYPLETVLSEKLHAIVAWGSANSRLKDYFDVHLLVGMHAFEGSSIVNAIVNTFEVQERPIPHLPLAGLNADFAKDRRVAWGIFLDKIDERNDIPFGSVVEDLCDFYHPLVDAAREGQVMNGVWRPKQGWDYQRALSLLP